MQQCLKCKTWVESKDITTGGCVNCNSGAVLNNWDIPDTGEDLWTFWNRRVQEAAEVIQLVCETRYNGSKRCTECPMRLGEGRECSVGASGILPKDWRRKNRSVLEIPSEIPVNYTGSPVWRDNLGGYYGEGVGRNPQGVFCGECLKETCEGCTNKDAVK